MRLLGRSVRPAWLCGIAVLAAGILSMPTLSHEFVLWDDEALILSDPAIKEFSPRSIARVFSSYDPELFTPLTRVSYQAEHALFGFSPLVFHLDNLLLHLLNIALLFLLMRRWSRSDAAAFVGSLLFAVHPIAVETVSWISARKDLLATLFTLLTILSYGSFLRRGSPRYCFLALLCFLFGLLSKPSSMFLPILLSILPLLEHREGEQRWAFKSTLPFFALSAIAGIIALFGKGQSFGDLPPLQGMLLIPKSIFVAFLHIVWPFGLSIVYPQDLPFSVLSWDIGGSMGLLAIFLIALWMSRKRYPILPFGSLWFLLLLLPSHLTFAHPGGIYLTADRYAYLPSIGLFFAFAVGVMSLWKRSAPSGRFMVSGILIVLLGILLWASMQRIPVWANSVALFRSAVTTTPEDASMHVNLAVAFLREGKLDEAKEEAEHARSLDPESALIENTLGNIARQEKKPDEALVHFKTAVTLDPMYAEAWVNLGAMLLDTGEVEEAVQAFRSAIAINPNLAIAHANLASAYGKQGKYREALEELRIALMLDPDPEKRELLQRLEEGLQ